MGRKSSVSPTETTGAEEGGAWEEESGGSRKRHYGRAFRR